MDWWGGDLGDLAVIYRKVHILPHVQGGRAWEWDALCVRASARPLPSGARCTLLPMASVTALDERRPGGIWRSNMSAVALQRDIPVPREKWRLH